MYNYQIGERFIIHSYKHNGNIHRAWDEAVLLDDCGEYLVFGNNRTKVLEADGRSWRTKEPAIMFFYKNKWYNVIGQLKSNGIYYYCNIITYRSAFTAYLFWLGKNTRRRFSCVDKFFFFLKRAVSFC